MLHSETNFFHSSRRQISIFGCESTLLKVFEVFLDSQRDFYHISSLPIGFKGRPKRADQQVWACFDCTWKQIRLMYQHTKPISYTKILAK